LSRYITAKILACIAVPATALLGQTAPVFDVASIKPAGALQAQVAAGKLHIGMSIDAARVDIGSMSLADLIPLAFGVKQYQVVGPDWMNQNRFDILAKMPEGSTKDQVPQMLQALLVDRFKLVVHRESREHPIYALIVGKTGSKLKESPPEAEPPPADPKSTVLLNAPEGQVRMGGDAKGVTISGGSMGNMRITPGQNGTMHLESTNTKLPAFADLLTRFVDRPVIDMTELKGSYTIGLDLSLAELRNVAKAAGIGVPGAGLDAGRAGRGGTVDASDPGGNTVFESVQQLGLKLDPRKSPVGTIVVDHIEKTPTEN
jgi:uncharacterized protein (TIGR03435 family)